MCLQAVEDWKHLGIEADAAALLLARIDTLGDAGEAEAQALAESFEQSGALWANQSTDDLEAEALFEARRLAYPALERLSPCSPKTSAYQGRRCRTCSSRSRRSRPATACVSPRSPTPATGTCIPLLLTPPGDDAARRAAQLAFEDLLDAAIALGGTVTGEHGVGLLKMGGMRREPIPARYSCKKKSSAPSTR